MILVDGNFIKVAQNARLDYKSMLQETVVGKTRISEYLIFIILIIEC